MKHSDTATEYSPAASGTAPAAGRGKAEVLRDPGIPFAEFVTIIALLMALNALAIDVMLPALPAIGEALKIQEENNRQMVLLLYLVGFGGGQLFFGPIADTLGRRKVLIGGLALYSLASVAAILTNDLTQFLAARVLQGVGCAAARVTALSIVRDCFTGRRMAKVMSLVMMVFMAVPIVAPSIGQAILFVAGWHWIFTMLLAAGVGMLAWTGLRLPETLAPEHRQPMVVSNIAGAYWKALTTQVTFGYTIGLAFIFGGLFAFLAMSQQIFVDVFGLGAYFPLVFAAIAIAMAGSSFMNARLVEAIGMRRLSHAAALAFTALGFSIAAVAAAGFENLWLFLILTTLVMTTFGFLGANFNTMAMEPLGDIAGTASSVIGFVSTLGGAILGYLMGQMFDGSTLPLGLAFGFYGVAAIACILFAERGSMFHALERAE
nr:multidrug effflux MFS transporter [Labrenzia sp. PHM005]